MNTVPPLPLPSTTGSTPGKPAVLTHYPAPPPDDAAPADPAAVECALADWFGRPVVLLGSGRAGIFLFMQALGLGRYRDRVTVPPYLSTCVMDTLARHAFPVQGTQASELSLLYHQYGLPQAARPSGPVLEDICHRFFATARTGVRDWAGEAAVFSLPKFFGIAGMGGGLVLRDEKAARDIRALRDGTEAELPGTRDWMRQVIATTYRDPAASPLAPLLESAYALLVRYPRPESADLAGFPADVDGIAEIGGKRARTVGLLLDRLGTGAAPEAVMAAVRDGIPFAFPYFADGDPERLRAGNAALAEAGIHAGVYNLDVRRNMKNPDYRPCLLLPCHQDVTDGDVETVAGLLGR